MILYNLLMMKPKRKYLLRLSYLYRDHLYWIIFTLIASGGCCHVVLFTFTYRGVFEFAYLLFNVFTHFDTFFCIMYADFIFYVSLRIWTLRFPTVNYWQWNKFTGLTPHVHFIGGQKIENSSTALADPKIHRIPAVIWSYPF